MSYFNSVLPKYLAGQLLSILLLALITAFAIAIIVTLFLKQVNDKNTRDHHTVERVYELTTIMEALSVDTRQQFAGTAKTRTTIIAVENEPAVIETANNIRSVNMASAISTAIDRQDIRTAILSRSDLKLMATNANRVVIAVPSLYQFRYIQMVGSTFIHVNHSAGTQAPINNSCSWFSVFHYFA